jgi:hypothetical protein
MWLEHKWQWEPEQIENKSEEEKKNSNRRLQNKWPEQCKFTIGENRQPGGSNETKWRWKKCHISKL